MKLIISALLNLGVAIVVKADELTCLDNPFYKYGDDKELTCQKIRNDETKRQRYCQEREVHQYCPQTCGDCCDDNGKCCVDDPDFSFDVNGNDNNCKWLSRQEPYWQNIFCPLLKNGILVKNACIETCGLCIIGKRVKKQSITSPPTSRSDMSLPTSSQLNSSSPPFSQGAYAKCKDDEDYYVRTPVGLKKCQWVGNNQQRKKTYCNKENNGSIVGDMCPMSCGKCCKDNPHYYFIEDGKRRKCRWLINQKRTNKWCRMWMRGLFVSEACPIKCRKCCADDTDFSFKVNGKDRNCKWLAGQTSERQNKLCPLVKNGIVVENSCIETCGLCIAGEPLTVTPSMSPSTSIAPTVSSKPTQAPSKSTEPTSDATSSWPTTSIPSTSSSPTVKRKPNILLILADDVGVGDVKGYWNDSHSQVHMPHMEDLVRNGTTFFNAHSTPLCAPSRYVLLSGNYQHRGHFNEGAWDLGSYGQFIGKQMSIAEVLKTQGNYHTAVMGKWHLGGRIRPNGLQGDPKKMLSNNKHDFKLPIQQGAKSVGFESSLISMSGIQGPPYSFFRNDFIDTNPIKYWDLGSYDVPFGKSKIIRPGEGAKDWDSTVYNMILVNETNHFLDRHMRKRPNDPFFAYVALGAAHIPHTPPNFFLNGDPIANQYGTAHMDMLSEIDMTLGALTKGLKDRGLLENTIIIFTSDNGGLNPKTTGSDKYNHHSSSKLRGYKASPYEGGHRVPFIMRYDGVIPAGEKEDSLIGLNDVFATLCDMAGIQVPSGQAHDSMSFADLIIPGSLKRDRRESLGLWRFKTNKKDPMWETLVTPKFKLIHYENATVELYDLKNDLEEKVDLSSNPFYKTRIKNMKKDVSKIGAHRKILKHADDPDFTFKEDYDKKVDCEYV